MLGALQLRWETMPVGFPKEFGIHPRRPGCTQCRRDDIQLGCPSIGGTSHVGATRQLPGLAQNHLEF